MFDFQARYAFVERIACRVALSNYTAGAMRDAPRHARAGIGIRVATVEPATDDFAVYRGKSSEVHTRKAFPSSSRHNSGSGAEVGGTKSWQKVAQRLFARPTRPSAFPFLPILGLPPMPSSSQDPSTTAPSSPSGKGLRSRNSVQRALDQCLEEGQLHRLHQLATSLNRIYHGDAAEH